MKQTVYAIIAAKNEEKNIGKVVKESGKYSSVIVVDDGSADKTSSLAEKNGAIVLRHIVNLGKGAALKTGCEYALSHGASVIIFLDADGQHEPKEIPRFLEKLRDSDIVFGQRTHKEKMPFILKFGNWFIYRMSRMLFGIDIVDTQGGYRAFRASVYPKIRWQSSGYSVESEIVANVGKRRLKYSTLPISTIYSDRYKGTTVIDGVRIVMNMIWWRMSR